MRRVVLLVVAATAVLPLMAFAGHRDLSDGDDTRGRLDLRMVRVNDGPPPRWGIYTWDRWTAAKAFDRGFIVVRFDTRDGERFDYFALVRSDGERLRASLHRDFRRRTDKQIARLKVRRPGRAAVRVWVRLGKMRFDRPGRRYRWIVETVWTSSSCPRACLDRAPDRGAVSEPAPISSPTVPTPSVIPSAPSSARNQ